MAFESYQNVVPVCQALIKKPSFSGHEDGVVSVLKDLFQKAGFSDIQVDEYGSIIARAKGSRPGPTLLFDAHIDTVPVGEESKWTHPPFEAKIENGRIYGRGTSDMKGALSAMITAAGAFLGKAKGDFAGEIAIAGVVHEECFEGVAARSVSKRVSPDYVIIGEASELNLKVGQRGRAEIVAETFGKSAHSANPEKGINAVYSMMKLIDALKKMPCIEKPPLGKGILELTDIKSLPYPGASVVPDYCRATYDRRLLVGETPESVLSPLNQEIERLSAADPSFHARLSFAKGSEKCHTGSTITGERFFPGWLFNEKEPFIQTALQALRNAGLAPAITQYSFCTNGSHYAGEAGIRTFGFGPSRENLAHTVDEYVEIEQLKAACAGYNAIIRAFTA